MPVRAHAREHAHTYVRSRVRARIRTRIHALIRNTDHTDVEGFGACWRTQDSRMGKGDLGRRSALRECLARSHEATKAQGWPCFASPPLRLLPDSRARHSRHRECGITGLRACRGKCRDAILPDAVANELPGWAARRRLAKRNRSAPGFKEIKDKELKDFKEGGAHRGSHASRELRSLTAAPPSTPLSLNSLKSLSSLFCARNESPSGDEGVKRTALPGAWGEEPHKPNF